ncbi:hypothetical protein [Pedobacter sp. SYSU D00535]|uniref:hypothetical protein n=1 Tax=Pedobacter sp. SYSU D00535 TaxID=2810308 RepID=UPI001A97C35F|nr:hypothetical protein [Pedobacter sp. SYSU D00535]
MSKVYQNVIAPGDVAGLLIAVNETVKLFFTHYPEQLPEKSMIFIPKYMIGFLVKGIKETQLSPPATHFQEPFKNGGSFYFGLPIFFNHEDSIVVMAEDALSYPEDNQPMIKLYFDDRTAHTA